MTKRIISLILSLVLLFSTTIPALAESTEGVGEVSKVTNEEEIFNTEDNKPDIKDHEDDKTVVENSNEEGSAGLAEDSADSAVYEFSTPKVSKLINTPEGLKISWKAVSGAQKYRVFYKNASGKWAKLVDTTATSYIWTGAQEGAIYAFSVRCISADGASYTSDFDKIGKSITYSAAQLGGEQTEVGDSEEDEADTDASEKGEADAEESADGEADAEESADVEADAEESEDGEADAEKSEDVEADAEESEDGEAEVEESEDGEADAEESEDGEADAEESENGEADAEESADSVTDAEEAEVATLELAQGLVVGPVPEQEQGEDGPVALILYPVQTVPTISELTNTPEGVLISWNKLDGAAKYRVFRLNESGGWTKLGDTTGTSYLWTGAQEGSFYVFTIRCISADASAYTSNYDPAGKGITYTPTQLKGYPELLDLVSTPEGLKLTWKPIEGAQKYRVFYMNDAGGWVKIADTTATSYLWSGATLNRVNTLTVRCVSSDGKIYTSDYYKPGISRIYTKTEYESPKNVKATLTSESVKITWDAVTNATKYRVFYKLGGEESTSKWVKIQDTTGTSYTWTGAKEDTEYTFTVRCITADGKDYTSSLETLNFDTLTYKPVVLDTPQLSSVASATNGVVISWNAVPDAKQYRVFYKVGNGGWKKIADTAATSYTWTGAQSGTTYTFTVCCLSSNGSMYTSGFNAKGMTLTYKPAQLSTPVLHPPKNTNNGVAISWDEVPGAVKYRVFYRIGNGGWTKIADTTGVGYVWDGAQEDIRYTFTVRCIDSSGAYASNLDATGVSILYKKDGSSSEYALDTPQISSVNSVPNGVVISWNAVTGAEKYRVFYKYDGIGWTKIADTTSTSYTWTGAEVGREYTFTVRCINANASAYTSDYDETGKTIGAEYNTRSYLPTPVPKLTSTSKGISISWDPIEGAQKYRVFYKYGSLGWTKIIDTTSTSYLWEGARSGITYDITVRCISLDGTKYTSNEPWIPKSIDYEAEDLGIPTVWKYEYDTDSPNRVNLEWHPVSGAAKYRVFYKTASSGWIKIANTTDNKYTWTEAEGNSTYTFTVRCLSEDGKYYTSGFDAAGWTVTIPEYKAPTLKPLQEVAEGLSITWDPVPGAFKYRVFYQNENMGWTKIADTTSTSYVWTNISPNTKYTITVRCISYDGSFYTSKYNTTGVSKTTKLLDTPVLISADNVSGGVEITWRAVNRAQKYRVFYKTGNGGWRKIADTTDTSYTWSDAKPSTKYTFTVRCVSTDGSTYTSDYNEEGIPVTTLDSNLTSILANGSYQQSSARSVLTLINAMRADEAWYWHSDDVTREELTGLGQLTYSDSLEKIAMQRAAELVQRYSNAYRPDGKPFSSLDYNGVTSSCEIIARGYSSAQAVFDALAAASGSYSSQSNRRTLLGGYRSIGIACFQYGGTTYWVLEFN